MQPRWLHEWFAFGVFASWTAGFLISRSAGPPKGRWAGEDMVRLTPLLAFLMALVAAAPLYLRTRWARDRRFRYRFLVPVVLGLLHAPLCAGTMLLAESVCRAPVIDIVALGAMFGWSIVLGGEEIGVSSFFWGKKLVSVLFSGRNWCQFFFLGRNWCQFFFLDVSREFPVEFWHGTTSASHR